MKPITITEERMNEILPQNIKDTDVITPNAKKVLAVIMNYFLTLDKVKEQGYVFLSNNTLRESARIKKEDMMEAIQELKEHNLIKRKVGKTWIEGEEKTASIYYVIWDNLLKPLKKNGFEDLFSSFLKSSGTPMGTTVIVSDTVSVKDSDLVEDLELVEVLEKEKDLVEVEDEEKVKETVTASTKDSISKECNTLNKNKQYQTLCEPLEEIPSNDDFDYTSMNRELLNEYETIESNILIPSE